MGGLIGYGISIWQSGYYATAGIIDVCELDSSVRNEMFVELETDPDLFSSVGATRSPVSLLRSFIIQLQFVSINISPLRGFFGF